MAETEERQSPPARSAPSEITPEPSDPISLPDEIARQRGVPKTPSGWWTFGLTVMAILIAVVLWLRYY
jgi:hypothetical protein